VLTGKPRIPEEWNYGPIVCRYSPDLTVLQGPTSAKRGNRRYLGWGIKDVLEKYRFMGTLPTAMILEGWPTDIFMGNRKKELKAACDLLARDGVRSMIWMRCGSVISRNAPGFRKEYEVHVNVTDENGIVKIPYTTQIPDVSLRGGNPDVGGNRAHAVLDITDPAAWNWYVSTVWKGLVDCGVSGAKIDFCEELPDDNYLYGRSRVQYKWKNPSVFAGISVHHAYPVFFVSKLCRDLSAMLKDRGGFMPFVRGGGLGSQRNPFMWAGDQQRCMDKIDDQILAVLNSGISGVPFMTYDMAGYQYSDMINEPVAVWNSSAQELDLSRVAAKKGEEVVYLRRSSTLSEKEETQVFALSAAFTAYMPCVQTHGFVRNPYDSTKMAEAYRSMVETHHALRHARAEVVRQTVESGVPMVRPLVMDYQDDENTWDIEDEFLSAGGFLVAPLLSTERTREVYLPEGKWRDVSTGELYNVDRKGLRIKKNIDIGGIAVYQRIVR
jgi:alpha-glucosidase (family GH31 glycosyl hydrolase)